MTNSVMTHPSSQAPLAQQTRPGHGGSRRSTHETEQATRRQPQGACPRPSPHTPPAQRNRRPPPHLPSIPCRIGTILTTLTILASICGAPSPVGTYMHNNRTTSTPTSSPTSAPELGNKYATQRLQDESNKKERFFRHPSSPFALSLPPVALTGTSPLAFWRLAVCASSLAVREFPARRCKAPRIYPSLPV
ncbi:hypothetical protein M758_2G209400 [Ceratodon purpureus]|nr:hypothetical protein M758_2G209400 [Ceratodon purpureus]